MACSQFLCSNYFSTSQNSFRSNHQRQFGYGSCNFTSKIQFQRTPLVRFKLKAMVSYSNASRRQVEIVYDPDEKLADEVDKNAPLSRLTLFSPCKINVFLRITNKRADGYHDLASLFHVIRFGDTIKFSVTIDNKGPFVHQCVWDSH